MAASPASDGAPQTGSSQPSSSRDTMASNTTMEPTSLTMEELRKITNNFSDDRAIGQGSYGKVYRGVHDNGEEIAVKVFYNNMQAIGDEQFRHEFDNLMMLKHQNIVRLVGYCYETQHQHMEFEGRIVFGDVTSKALCFEYMHKGSLQKHISDECHGLDWHTRYKIIKGTCEGLKYLHEGFKEPLYHLDLKPDNILLDENMVPKLADFGLSKFFSEGKTRVTQSPIGTRGYLPPEYIHQHLVSKKLDIFSLGVVMIEIIAGPTGHSRSAEMPYQEFIDQVYQNWRNRLEATCSSPGPLEAYCEQVNICIDIALSCMGPDRQKRPNIVDIIHKLNETETVIDKALSLSGRSLSWMPGALVKVQAFTRSRAIQGADTYNEFPVLVRVTAAPWRHAEKMPRDGVDIVAVLDINRSVLLPWNMPYIKQALKMVIDRLGPNDRLSIVSFVDKSPRIMELTYMSDQGQDVARLRLNEPVGNLCNNMVAALREGAEILRKREMDKSASRVGCIMFLSNGDDRFYTQDISSEFPVHAFGLHPYIWTTSARFMKYIADKTSGTYSFVVNHDTSEIRGALELFITGLTSLVAMPVKITLAAHEGVTISSIESGGYGNLVTPDQRSGEIHVDNIYAGEQKNFIVYLTVADGNEKLLTVGGAYRSRLNESMKQLADTDVFVLRPCCRPCTSGELSIHHEVAAEMVRIRLWKEVSDFRQVGRKMVRRFRVYNNTEVSMRYMFEGDKLQARWDMIENWDVGRAAPKETLSDLGKDVAEMKMDLRRGEPNFYAPYTMSWLSSHKWQRATTKGTSSMSGAFQVPRN